MQRRGQLSPDGRAPSITRSANPLPPLFPSLYPCGASARCRREVAAGSGSPAGSGSRCSDRAAAPPGAGRGARLGAAPARGRARCRRCPEGATGPGPAERDRRNARKASSPCRGLGSSSGSGSAPGASSRTAKLTNLGQGWRPLRSARTPPRTALGLGRPRGSAGTGGSGQAAPLLAHVAIIFSRCFYVSPSIG